MLNIEKGTVADSLYLQFSEKPISHSVEVDENIVIDVADDGFVVGLDLQYVTEILENRKSFDAVYAQTPSINLQLV